MDGPHHGQQLLGVQLPVDAQWSVVACRLINGGCGQNMSKDRGSHNFSQLSNSCLAQKPLTSGTVHPCTEHGQKPLHSRHNSTPLHQALSEAPTLQAQQTFTLSVL